MFTQICSLRQGLIAYNTITHKIIQLNMPCYCPNNHISLFLIPDWSFRSRWTQKGDLKLRPQSSQICPLKGPYSWMVDWMSIRGIYYCLYEVHWLGSMVFHDMIPISWSYSMLSDPPQRSRLVKWRQRGSKSIYAKEDLEKRRLNVRIIVTMKSKCGCTKPF